MYSCDLVSFHSLLQSGLQMLPVQKHEDQKCWRHLGINCQPHPEGHQAARHGQLAGGCAKLFLQRHCRIQKKAKPQMQFCNHQARSSLHAIESISASPLWLLGGQTQTVLPASTLQRLIARNQNPSKILACLMNPITNLLEPSECDGVALYSDLLSVICLCLKFWRSWSGQTPPSASTAIDPATRRCNRKELVICWDTQKQILPPLTYINPPQWNVLPFSE